MPPLFPYQSNAWAKDSSVAIGRNNINSPIYIGLDEGGVRLVLQQELARIAGERGVPIAPLSAILEKLGETSVTRDQIPALLETKADELIALKAKLAQRRHVRPEFAGIRERASRLIESGEFVAAREQLALGRQTARKAREDTSRSEAEFLRDEARVDLLQFDYRAAAGKYAEAADLMAPFDATSQLDHLQQSSEILYKEWEEFGIEQALTDSQIVLLRCANLVSRESHPVSWAMIQSHLGALLHAQAQHHGSLKFLRDALVAYETSMTALKPDETPDLWATVHHNLGYALLDLAEREGSVDRANEAITVVRRAIIEASEAQDAELKASSQNILGNALLFLGETEESTDRIAESVDSYMECLNIWSRNAAPRQWAMVNINLGNAHLVLGKLEVVPEPLERAVAAFKCALEVFSQDRYPVNWAATQNNLGNALSRLGTYRNDSTLIEEGVSALRSVLLDRSVQESPVDWASVQANLGSALEELSESQATDGLSMDAIQVTVNQAIAAYRSALEGDFLVKSGRRSVVEIALNNMIAVRDLGEALSKIPSLVSESSNDDQQQATRDDLSS